jgi:hypothetical protein
VTLVAGTWVYTSADVAGNAITLTVTFDEATLALVSVTATRDPGCLYANVYFGLGADGIPDSTARKIAGVSGTVTVQAALLASYGFSTITDVLSRQITAGP